MKLFASAVLIAGLAVLPDGLLSRARANDTAAELSVGGLIFKQSDSVSIESEELTIIAGCRDGPLSFHQPEPQSRHLDGRVPVS